MQDDAVSLIIQLTSLKMFMSCFMLLYLCSDLQAFREFDFGEVPLGCVHLSKRLEVDPSGYYKCVCECGI